MTLTIEISPIQEQLVREAAECEGISVSEVVWRAFQERFPASNSTINNAPPSADERAEEEQLFAQLHANMNETRRSLEMEEL